MKPTANKDDSIYSSFQVTCPRFIAHLDIMGFKDLVYRNSHNDVAKIMNVACFNVQNLKEFEADSLKIKAKNKPDIAKGIVLPVMFSDSVLLVSRSNTIYDARKIAYAVSFLMYTMLVAHIPLKGALSYGIFTADFKNSRFFGRPLIDSYLLSEDINFYGAVLHHTFENYLRKNKEEWPAEFLKTEPVPLKAGNITHGFIDWRFHLGKHLRKDRSTRTILQSFYNTVSGNTRRYVDNTINVYRDVEDKVKGK